MGHQVDPSHLHGDELRVLCTSDMGRGLLRDRLDHLMSCKAVFAAEHVDGPAVARLVSAGLGAVEPGRTYRFTLLPHAPQHPAILEQLWALGGSST